MADEIEKVVVYDRSKDLGDKLAAILGAPGKVYYRPKNNITMTFFYRKLYIPRLLVNSLQSILQYIDNSP